jgi:hypothetical protein
MGRSNRCPDQDKQKTRDFKISPSVAKAVGNNRGAHGNEEAETEASVKRVLGPPEEAKR